jgi:hypothetical protein
MVCRSVAAAGLGGVHTWVHSWNAVDTALAYPRPVPSDLPGCARSTLWDPTSLAGYICHRTVRGIPGERPMKNGCALTLAIFYSRGQKMCLETVVLEIVGRMRGKKAAVVLKPECSSYWGLGVVVCHNYLAHASGLVEAPDWRVVVPCYCSSAVSAVGFAVAVGFAIVAAAVVAAAAEVQELADFVVAVHQTYHSRRKGG